MGNKSFGPPRTLLDLVRERSQARVFIETGTYRARTALAMAEFFETVITIEVKVDFYEEALAKADGVDNVHFVLGDSGQMMKAIAPLLTEPAVIWLDAHVMRGAKGGANDNPILAEIEALNNAPVPQYILIDDMTIFKTGRKGWPSIKELKAALKARHDYVFTEQDDVLLAAPRGWLQDSDSERAQRDATPILDA